MLPFQDPWGYAWYEWDDMELWVAISSVEMSIARLSDAVWEIAQLLFQHLVPQPLNVQENATGLVNASASVLAAVSSAVASSLRNGVLGFGKFLLDRIESIINWVVTVARDIYSKFVHFVNSVEQNFKKVLEIIHFKTILKIHKIVMIVSPQYRAMMKRMYAYMARVSEALGLGPNFMILALQNVRNLVLDVSSMFGKNYDLEQVAWLSTLNNYLKTFNTRVAQYVLDPESLLFDLGELIERPAQDAKAVFQASIISGLDTALEFAAKMGNGLSAIGIDVVTIHNDLPQFIKDRIPDPGIHFWENLTGFMNEHINPVISELQSEVSVWNQELLTSQQTVAGLVGQLRKPGTLIAGIDALPLLERQEQDRILADFSNRRLGRLVYRMTPFVEHSISQLDSNARIAIPPPTVSPALSYEPQSVSVPGVGPSTQRGAWFVGDY